MNALNDLYMKKWSQTLKRNYGLTAEQWLKMFDVQKGKCPICIKPILKPGNEQGKRAACVDHDHKTGRVRGLLHRNCNYRKVGNTSLALAKRIYEYLANNFDGRNL